MMTSDLLTPYKGNHAIQNVTFALEWAGGFDAALFHEIRGNLAITEKFPKATEQKAIILNIDGSIGVPSSQTHDVSGIVFEKFNSHGMLSKSLAINRQHCLIANNEYTRWLNIWFEARDLFGYVLPIAAKHNKNIAAIGLQYTDIFTWHGTSHNFDLSMIFNQDSQVLPKHVFGLKKLWHIHQGYFKKTTEEADCETLNNININLVAEGGVLQIQIITAHRAIFTQPATNIEKWGQKDSMLDKIVCNLHDENKLILSDLLTHDIQCKIKLSKEANP
jgi:uncharacterized protein (TIGR04255 family)